jgi:hypothetical protein
MYTEGIRRFYNPGVTFHIRAWRVRSEADRALGISFRRGKDSGPARRRVHVVEDSMRADAIYRMGDLRVNRSDCHSLHQYRPVYWTWNAAVALARFKTGEAAATGSEDKIKPDSLA